MFESNVYNNGSLIVGKMSGIIEPQSFMNSIFWQIDSRNVGEVKAGFSQLYYDIAVESVDVNEDDVRKIAAFNTGIASQVGRGRSALVFRHPEVIRLGLLHQTLAEERGIQVALFNTLEAGFKWLNCDNPDPKTIMLE